MKVRLNLNSPYLATVQDSGYHVKFWFKKLREREYVIRISGDRDPSDAVLLNKYRRAAGWVMRRTHNITHRDIMVEYDMSTRIVTVYWQLTDYQWVADIGTKVHYIGDESRDTVGWDQSRKAAGVVLNAMFPPRVNPAVRTAERSER